MANDGLEKTLRRNGYWIALVIAVLFGYTYGKDRALRDNAMDDRAVIEATTAP